MIRLHKIQIGYQGESIGIPITGRFRHGSMTAIIGINGIGKSTLLKTLAGLLPIISGKLEFSTKIRPRISYLPQTTKIDHKFPLTVFDVVSMGCWPSIGLLQRINFHYKLLIWQGLEIVGLDNIASCSISDLSNGQFQRMLFARLLVQQAPLILLDEPFNSIDGETCSLLMEIINRMHKQGQTIIMVLHNKQLVTQYFPDTLLLTQTYNIFGPSSEVLLRL